MKELIHLVILSAFAFGPVGGRAQPDAANPAAGGQPLGEYVITARGPHERTWARVVCETNRLGQLIAKTNTAYVELSTGLHYADPTTGQWAESQESFEITPEGYALARHGQHQVILAPNINVTSAVEVVMPDGQHLTSRPWGLAFYDTASRASVLVAKLKDCGGQWLSPNVVVYPDAFDGLKAALRYTYTRVGFEQDVVLYEKPNSPAAYGLNPATTQLEIWTEFSAAPQPRVTTVAKGDGSADERVEFAAMALGQGRAYFLDLANRVEPSVAVRKSWHEIGERTFLVEAVHYATSQPLLNRLVAVPEGTTTRLAQKVVKGREALVAQLTRRVTTEPMLIARITPGQTSSQPGLILDYTALNSSQTNYVFKGDATYYVSGPVNLYGTTTIEGGSVVKFATNATGSIVIQDALDCRTAAYRPAVFTAKDDNSVGETISESTGSPAGRYGGAAVVLPWNLDPVTTLQSARFSYLRTGVDTTVGGYFVLKDLQFVNCTYPFSIAGGLQYLFNVLICDAQTAFYGGGSVIATHLTVHNCGTLADDYFEYGSDLAMTNSLLVSVTNLGNYVVFETNHTVTIGSDTGVFQTVGAASHYLADGSTNRNAGTTNISTSLLAALRERTTYPPVLLSNVTASADTSLSPQAQRDADAPDLGYHYDPIDYLACRYGVTNATLTLSPGTVIGYCYDAALRLSGGGEIKCAGTATAPIRFVPYVSVQEQSQVLGGWWAGMAMAVSSYRDAGLPAPGEFRFTQFRNLPGGPDTWHLYAVSQSWGYTALSIRDCCFEGGSVQAADVDCDVTLRNNCFENTEVSALNWSESALTLAVQNNLFHGGRFTVETWAVALGSAHDNAFDGVTIDDACDPPLTHSHNVYINCTGRLQPTNASDIVLSNFSYTTGPLGDYYQVSTNLLDAGSRSAGLAGLYHYTTTTNQVKEASSQVDIGFHYVALNTNGVPVDTDGDGLPDYNDLDSDGDGLPDAWELQYLGNLTLTASGDPDEDDLANLQEYQLGTNPTSWDTDGDGLSDSEEFEIPVDVNNPALGHLDPLDPDTGNTGKTDDLKDSDHDAITNLGELRDYMSNPATAHTFNAEKDDAEYLFTAEMGQANTLAVLSYPSFPGGGLLRFTITDAFPHARYDVYFVNTIEPLYYLEQRWKFRRVYSDVHCDSAGKATFMFPIPDPNAGFFEILAAEDADQDGLGDGYESWFAYSGGRTAVDDPDTDLDQMWDGWEASYGLNPTDSADGGTSNSDGDGFYNVDEYDANPHFADPSYDPLKYYGNTTPGQQARPLVSVSTSDPQADLLGGTASFTIHRSIGAGADLSQDLTVYYSVGGSATYGTDYSLTLAPTGTPRIFAAKIEAGQTARTVALTPSAAGISQAGMQTVVVKLTPYGVSTYPAQTPDPLAWGYAVDLLQEAVTLKIYNGILINLEKTVPNGYLRIKPTSATSPLPYLNVANSTRGTVARIYTGANLSSDPSRIVGEYYSAPHNMGRNPSRTTVDRYGNVWVGNRAQGEDPNDGYGGSITEFGLVIGGTRCDANGSADPNGEYLKPPFIYNTCVDRHGATINDPPDGLIRTSRGANPNLQLAWSNAGNADSLGGVSTAEDEAILRYLRVAPTAVRAIIVDPGNNLWVGSHPPSGLVIGNGWNEFIDVTAGMQVTGRRLNFQGGGYGGVIDGYGAVWLSGFEANPDLSRSVRFLPGATMPVTTGGTIRHTGDNYGVTVDPGTGDVWQPLYTSANVMHFRADHCTTTFPIGQSQNRGIAIDGRGHVWVGGSEAESKVYHLTTSGTSVGSIPMTFTPPGQSTISGIEPIGVAVDASGMVWAICRGGEAGLHGYAMRIDPQQNPETDPNHVPPIGKVVEIVDLGVDSGPYNYSDMSGFVTLGATQPSGVWDHVEDAETADTLWTSLTMAASAPTGTRIIVEVRAANSIAELPSWPFRPVVNAQGVTPPGQSTLPSGTKGRYIEVRANLLRNPGVTSSPELQSLTVQPGATGCAIQITAHPKSLAVSPGAAAIFAVTAQVPGGSTATYQWLKDGAVISGANGPQLTVSSADYNSAARYSVLVGASGCGFQLESAPARLHVTGNPPELTYDLAPSLTVTEGLSEVLWAGASAGTNPGEKPIYYQWRFNNAAIPGASGNCGSGDCYISLNVQGQCVNAGQYSVLFWNQYGQVSTLNCEVTIAGKSPVTVTPSEVIVSTADQVVALTATTCLGSVSCVQWYLTRDGQKAPIPGANTLAYTIPTPITCDKLGAYTVSVADGAWNAYEASATVSAGGGSTTVSLSSTTLHFTPDGPGPWSYQWSSSDNEYLNFADIPGATSPDFALPLGAGYYKVTATSSAGTATATVYNDSSTPETRACVVQNGTLAVTYAAQASGSAWAYQWYFTPDSTSIEEIISGATASQYTIQSVNCTKMGTYRVQVNCIGGSAAARLTVAAPGLSSTTLGIAPGSGTWTYTWYYSTDDISYEPLLPNPGTAYYTIRKGELAWPGRYYKVEATRAGANASVRMHCYSDPWYGTAARVVASASADASVAFAAGAVGGGAAFQWYFTPASTGNEGIIPGATGSQYTIQPAGCGQRGTYRVEITDACGGVSSAYAYLAVDNCP